MEGRREDMRERGKGRGNAETERQADQTVPEVAGWLIAGPPGT